METLNPAQSNPINLKLMRNTGTGFVVLSHHSLLHYYN